MRARTLVGCNVKFLWSTATFFALLSFAKHTQAQLPLYDPANADGWHFNSLLSDEFDGTQLDASKWHIQGTNDFYYSNFIGRAPSQFSTNNVRVEGGKLKLETRWDPDFEFSPNPGQGGLAYENFTTAAVIGKRQVSHGYLEIRARAADVSVASAFWLLGNEAELDVYEHLGNPSLSGKEHLETEIWSSIRDWSPGGNGDPTWTDRRQLPFRVAGDFHVYGLEWDENYLNFHVDGQLLDSVTRAEVESATPGGWTVEYPMRIWVDSETFPWHGVPGQADLPESYEIDYIRVWQHSPPQATSGAVFEDDFSDPTLDLVWNTGNGFFLNTANESALLSTFGTNWGAQGDDAGLLNSDVGYATFTVAADGANPIGGNFTIGNTTFTNTAHALARINLAHEGAGTYELVWNNSGTSAEFEMASGWAGLIDGNRYVWIIDGDWENAHWGFTTNAGLVSLGDAATTFGFWHASPSSSAVIDDFALYDTLTPLTASSGDLNGDGLTDGTDLLLWQRSDGTPATLANWQSTYGNIAALNQTSVAIPEPCTVILALFGLGLPGGRRMS